MPDELDALLNIAMDREIVSQSTYMAGQKKTLDPGAIQLMKELAEQELHHYQWLKEFKEGHLETKATLPKKLADLQLTEYLLDTGISEGAGLQDVLTTAMNREKLSVEFYSDMKKVMPGAGGKQLCDRLMNEERQHKLKLESLYDELFNKEN